MDRWQQVFASLDRGSPDWGGLAGWVEEVASTRDVDLRGHRVALTYHYLARRLDEDINGSDSVWRRLEDRKNPAGRDATWFNFATWATVTINRDLALRRTPSGSDRLVPAPLRSALTPLLFHLRAQDGQRISRALSWGQRLVFLSTTLSYVAHRMGTGAADTFARVEALTEWGGCSTIDRAVFQVVWDAFERYGTAADAGRLLRDLGPDRGEVQQHLWCRRLEAIRARSILLANLMITAVEQQVVNDAVGDVIDGLPDRLSTRVVNSMARWGDRYLGFQRELTGLQLPLQLAQPSDAITDAWARLMTAQILVMILPCETLRLGRDVPPLYEGVPYFPPDLSDLTALPGPANDDDPPLADDVNRDLRRLVAMFDRSRGDGHGSAARDWRSYHDRMNWAVNMLRSRQQDLSLYWCPYTDDDQRRIIEGRLPNGSGDPSDYEVGAPLTKLHDRRHPYGNPLRARVTGSQR